MLLEADTSVTGLIGAPAATRDATRTETGRITSGGLFSCGIKLLMILSPREPLPIWDYYDLLSLLMVKARESLDSQAPTRFDWKAGRVIQDPAGVPKRLSAAGTERSG